MKKVTIDCSSITQSADMHAVLASELSFPKWYGHNLDALFDCLTEIEETTLILINWNPAADWADGFAETFSDAAAENPDFTIEIQ